MSLNNIFNFIKSNWFWIVLVVFVLFIIIRTKIRGYFWRNKKTDEELNAREFFGLWRKGIDGITPLQQSRSQVMGNIIVLVGVISGIIINILTRVENQWVWICIVLSGSLIITSISQIGYLQKYWRLKIVDKQVKELENV